jgi:tRNA 2-thiouridine synthesizing protein B
MLHIVNKSPSQTRTLASCLRLAQPGHAVLLIEDGVYAATRGNSDAAELHAACGQLKVYVLKPDLEARGMQGELAEGIGAVDYRGFVDLVAEHPSSHSWL